MKKMLRLLRKIVTSRAFTFVALVVLGLLLGLASGYRIWGNEEKATVGNRATVKLSDKELRQRRKDQAQARYEQAKQTIEYDVKQKKITQKQAEQILIKIDEVKAYIDGVDQTSREDRDAVREKRAELMKWAQENNVPAFYVMMVY